MKMNRLASRLTRNDKIAAGFMALDKHLGATFDECVQIVTKQGNARDPEAVCAFLKRQSGEIK